MDEPYGFARGGEEILVISTGYQQGENLPDRNTNGF